VCVFFFAYLYQNRSPAEGRGCKFACKLAVEQSETGFPYGSPKRKHTPLGVCFLFCLSVPKPKPCRRQRVQVCLQTCRRTKRDRIPVRVTARCVFSFLLICTKTEALPKAEGASLPANLPSSKARQDSRTGHHSVVRRAPKTAVEKVHKDEEFRRNSTY